MLTDKEMKIARYQYKTHIWNTTRYNGRVDRIGNQIEFRLTFEQWLDIWLQSGHWHDRGNKRDQYVMSRINDIGHYEIDNVEIKTAKENNTERHSRKSTKDKHTLRMKNVHSDLAFKKKHSDAVKQQLNDPIIKEKHLAGIKATVSKPISANGQIFSSAREAANALAPSNVTDKDSWIQYRLNRKSEDYYYINRLDI